MKNLSQVFCENKRVQRSVQTESTCITFGASKRVCSRRTEAGLLLWCKAHKLTCFRFPHCRWEMIHKFSLAEAFWNGCKWGLNNLLLSGKRDEDPCQSSHLLSSADKGVLPGKLSGWELLILSVFSVCSRIWAKHRKLWWLQNAFLENVFWSAASKLHQPSSLLRRTFSVLRSSQHSVCCFSTRVLMEAQAGGTRNTPVKGQKFSRFLFYIWEICISDFIPFTLTHFCLVSSRNRCGLSSNSV